jgi:hypothetical protein
MSVTTSDQFYTSLQNADTATFHQILISVEKLVFGTDFTGVTCSLQGTWVYGQSSAKQAQVNDAIAKYAAYALTVYPILKVLKQGWNSGTATISASGTMVPHGLGVIPSSYQVVEITPSVISAATALKVVEWKPPDATNLYLMVVSPTALATQVCRWYAQK